MQSMVEGAPRPRRPLRFQPSAGSGPPPPACGWSPSPSRGGATAAQLRDRYQAWRSPDTLKVGPLKEWLMSEARGEGGDLPLLLRGLPV